MLAGTAAMHCRKTMGATRLAERGITGQRMDNAGETDTTFREKKLLDAIITKIVLDHFCSALYFLLHVNIHDFTMV